MIHRKIHIVFYCLAVFSFLIATPMGRKSSLTSVKKNYNFPEAHIDFVTFRSSALSHNAIGDPSVRTFTVILPPNYHKSNQRYGVLYWLHGYGVYKDGHLANINELRHIYDSMSKGQLSEVIIVAVDGSNFFGGSYYSHSKIIGNYETYVADEIVKEVDRRYRTNPGRHGRALAGFSMGGHGALKIAMKYSYNFSIVGSLSGSPLSLHYRKIVYRTAAFNHKPVKTKEEFRAQITPEKNWNLATLYAKAAGFSSNLKNPPLYVELPFTKSSGEQDNPIWQSWQNEDPLGLIAKYASNLRSYRLIYLDHGDDEILLGTEDFDRELVRYGIGHIHYIFKGDHLDKLAQRIKRLVQHIGLYWGLD